MCMTLWVMNTISAMQWNNIVCNNIIQFIINNKT